MSLPTLPTLPSLHALDPSSNVAPHAKRARTEGALEELTLTELYKKVEEEGLRKEIDELLRLAIIEFFKQRSVKKASSSKELAKEPVKEPVEEQAKHLDKEPPPGYYSWGQNSPTRYYYGRQDLGEDGGDYKDGAPPGYYSWDKPHPRGKS